MADEWQQGERLATLPRGVNGEGLETSYEHSWPGSPWLTVLLLVVAALVVGACYWRERGTSGRPLRVVLAGVRCTLLLLVAWMIYGWAEQRHRTDLPDLIVILDDSQSMATVDQWDEAELPQEFLARLSSSDEAQASRLGLAKAMLTTGAAPWPKAAEARYHVKWFLTGETLRPLGSEMDELPQRLSGVQATQASSRLGQAVLDILQSQRGRPTAAIVLVTDGITTEGPAISDAAQQARRRQTPLYIVGVGSERAPRDVRLVELRVDEVAFVDDALHFDVQLSAQGYVGKSVLLRLRRDGEIAPLAEIRVTLGDDHTNQSARLTYRPTTEGRFQFIVEADPLPGEANSTNNRLQREVTVSEETVRVLLAQSGPSYEYRYLKGLLGRTLNIGSLSGKKAVDLRSLLQDADWESTSQDDRSLRVFPVTRDELFQYDVLILADVNPALFGTNALRNVADFVQTRGGGLIVLCGPQFMPRSYGGTALAEVLPFDPETTILPHPAAVLKDGFRPRLTPLGASASPLQLADSLSANERLWQRWPVFYWLLDASELKPGVRVLAEHPTRTGADGRNLPVFLLQFIGAGKVLSHTSDEVWRWSRDPETEPAYARYWLQWLRYLSRAKLQAGNRGVQISTDREEYERGEPVRLRARFLDERAAPSRDDGVTLVVEREGSERRNVQLVRDPTDRGLFEGTVGQLVDGRYRVGMLSPALEEPPAPARLVVVSPPGEQAKLEMDGAELRAAAKKSDGRFYTIHSVDTLPDDLPPGRQVRIESSPSAPLWNRWPFAALFVGLIVAEWIVRKRAGML